MSAGVNEKASVEAKEGGARSGLSRHICGLGLLAGLAGLALPWLTSFWLGFDVFSQFTVHFLILVAACALGALMTRHGFRLAASLVALGVIAIGGWATLHRSPEFTAPAGGGEIRVMSFNTWSRNDDVRAIAAEVRRRSPDILGMIEFHPAKRPLLAMLKAAYPHQIDCSGRPHCYLALFSRWPMRLIKARSLWRGPPYLHALVETPSGPVHVFVVHTLRFPWLGSQLKQVRAMRDVVRRVKGARIVMGDFNATPFSVMLSSFVRNSGLRRLTWLPTWPAWAGPLPQLAIDHVFISAEFERVGGPWIGDNAGSDHFPIIVTLRRHSGG